MLEQLQFKLEEINKYQSDISTLMDKYNELEQRVAHMDKIISVCSSMGTSKGLIESVKAIDPVLCQLFEDKGKGRLLDSSLYDHFPFKNDLNEEFKETIFSLQEVLNNISKSILQEVGEQIQLCHRTCNDYILLVKDYLTRTRMELSNTSREVIPAKARECSLTCYPIRDNKFDMSLDRQALTLDKLNLTTGRVIELIDEILGSVNSVDLKYVEFEKKYYKDVTEKLAQFNRNKILVLEGMKLIKHFQTCY
jgi:hypothetical protein